MSTVVALEMLINAGNLAACSLRWHELARPRRRVITRVMASQATSVTSAAVRCRSAHRCRRADRRVSH
jgi:hypothetical protein